MNASLAFLLAAVGLSLLGVLVLWTSQRRPQRFGSSIDDFREGLQALAPPDAHPSDSGDRPTSAARRVDGEPGEG